MQFYSVIIQNGQWIGDGDFCVIGHADAFSAINAALVYYLRFSVSDSYGFGGAMLDTVSAAHAFPCPVLLNDNTHSFPITCLTFDC